MRIALADLKGRDGFVNKDRASLYGLLALPLGASPPCSVVKARARKMVGLVVVSIPTCESKVSSMPRADAFGNPMTEGLA